MGFVESFPVPSTTSEPESAPTRKRLTLVIPINFSTFTQVFTSFAALLADVVLLVPIAYTLVCTVPRI